MAEYLDRAALKVQVDAYIDGFCAQKIQQAKRYDQSYIRLWKEIQRYIARGGKRVRPYLVVLAYQSHGGRQVDRIIPIAAAWEMLHAALLVHDDIIDRDLSRHGYLNIQGEYEKHYDGSRDGMHYAQGAALLAGDLLIASAFEMVLSSELNVVHKARAHQLLCDAIFGVAGGELMDVETIFDSISAAKTEKVARYKTAEYSCEYPLWCGATLAGVDDVSIEALRQFAIPLGIGYQLVDDLLGVFGESSVTGKSNSGDIREKKRTILLQKTFVALAPDKQKELVSIYQQDAELDEQTIARVRTLISQSGAHTAVENEIGQYYQEAEKSIAALKIDNEAKLRYREILDVFLKREF
jgi:geranylgeranyl diphosphate synthase, type II